PSPSCLVALLSIAGLSPYLAQSAQPSPARFELPKDDVLVDEAIPIVVSGLTPGAMVTVHLQGGAGGALASSATFAADRDGRIDLTRMAPAKGSYKDADAMGLFWSAERGGRPSAGAASDEPDATAPDRWTLTAESGGRGLRGAHVRPRARD